MLKLHESTLLLCSYPGDNKCAYVHIYEDYQDGNIKLKTILVEIFRFQNIYLVEESWS